MNVCVEKVNVCVEKVKVKECNAGRIKRNVEGEGMLESKKGFRIRIKEDKRRKDLI